MLEIAETEAAIFLADGDAVQPKLAHLRPQMAREFVLGVDLGSDRFDLVLGKAARRFADRIGHFAEVEIEHRVSHGKSSRNRPLAERNSGWEAALGLGRRRRRR